MSTLLGHQTVQVVTITYDENDRDRYNKPRKIRTETAVGGCRFRPLTFDEEIKLGDIGHQRWRLTAPPAAAILAADDIDEINVDGVAYQITGGMRVFPDFNGTPFKVTVLCERRSG